MTITTGLVDTFTTPRLLRADRGRAARPDAVRDASLPARRDDGGVRHVRRRRRDERAQGRARGASRVGAARELAVQASSDVRGRRLASGARLAAGAVDVILRDGGTLRLRPPRAGDADALARVLRARSRERSLYLRFHGAPTRRAGARRAVPRPRLGRARRARRHARRTSDGERDRRARELRAPARPAPRPRSRSPSPTTSRAAGSARACSSSSPRARPRPGSSASSPRCWPRTRAMLARLRGRRLRGRRASSRAARSRSRFPIAPTERLSRRASTSATTSPSPRRCGRSSQPRERRRDRRLARGAARSAASSSATSSPATSPAPPIPVNRSGEPVAGVRALRARSTRSPTPVDLAVICVPGAHVLDAAEAALAHGRARALRHLGRLRRDRRGGRASARSSCSRSCARTARGSSGPNCLGIAVPAPRLNATFAPRALPPGRIGFSSQSGALGLALLEKAAGARPRLLGVRLDRQQGRRLVERPARVVGGRRRHRRSCCSTSSRSATRASSRGSRAASRAASRSSR